MLLKTPIRRLEGVSWWVIEEPEAIRDFMNMEIRKEWEADARSEHKDEKDDQWLKTLQSRKWRLGLMEINQITLNPKIMNYVDRKRGYVFLKSLAKRSEELQRSVKLGGVVLSPLVVKSEGTQLVDGYCRYATLKAMRVSRVYAYVGAL